MKDNRKAQQLKIHKDITPAQVYHLVPKDVLASFGLNWDDVREPVSMARKGNLQLRQNQFGVNRLVGNNSKYGTVYFFQKGKVEEVDEAVKLLKREGKEIIGIMQGKHNGFTNIVVTK
jgi:hypothetical protein